MRDLDCIDLRRVERAGDRANVAETVLMTDRVHAVTQRDILDVKLAHASAIRAATFSAVRSAAEVMMSRLPA